MSVKRRQFTSQFKANVAMEARKGQRTIGELADLYQVHPPPGYQAPVDVYQARPTVGRSRGAAGGKAAPPPALRAPCGAALLGRKTLS